MSTSCKVNDYLISPSLPCLDSFVDILRVRCLSIWDRLEGEPQWKLPPAGVVPLLASYQIDEEEIENKVNAKLVNDMEKKIKKFQQQQKGGGKYIKLSLKRLIHSESKTMANILRKEQKHLKINKDSISRLKTLNDSDIIIITEGCVLNRNTNTTSMPVTWTQLSLRHLPSKYQMIVIREFNSIFHQLIGNVEEYKF